MAAVRKALSALGSLPAFPHLSTPSFSQVRHSNNFASPYVEDVTTRTEYARDRLPAEWSHVEDLLFRKTVPDPTPKAEYASWWKPPRPEVSADNPYFVSRNANHMLPVYLMISHAGQRRITLVKRVRGDIWSLRDELRRHIETEYERTVPVRVHELCAKLEVKGDYVQAVRRFLQDKGF